MTQREVIFRSYERLKLHEEQFSIHLAELKKIASGWLLATFGGLAYLVGNKNIAPIIDIYLLISAVALLGTIGLLVIWVLDRLLYYKLLKTVILLAIKMEHEYPDILPPIRTTILRTCGQFGFAIAIYYTVPIGVLAGISFYFHKLGVIAIIISLFVLIASIPTDFHKLALKCNDKKLAEILKQYEHRNNIKHI